MATDQPGSTSEVTTGPAAVIPAAETPAVAAAREPQSKTELISSTLGKDAPTATEPPKTETPAPAAAEAPKTEEAKPEAKPAAEVPAGEKKDDITLALEEKKRNMDRLLTEKTTKLADERKAFEEDRAAWKAEQEAAGKESAMDALTGLPELDPESFEEDDPARQLALQTNAVRKATAEVHELNKQLLQRVADVNEALAFQASQAFLDLVEPAIKNRFGAEMSRQALAEMLFKNQDLLEDDRFKETGWSVQLAEAAYLREHADALVAEAAKAAKEPAPTTKQSPPPAEPGGGVPPLQPASNGAMTKKERIEFELGGGSRKT